MSDYLENILINHVLRGVSFTSPGARYVALYTTDPTDANTGTEVAGGNYARQSIAFSAPVTPGITTNSAAVTFPVATADWGTITHFGILSALTGGNLWFAGRIETAGVADPKTVLIDNQVQFLTGQLEIDMD